MSTSSSAARLFVVIIFALISIPAFGQDSLLPLTKIDFTGLTNVGRDQSIAASGLQIGQRVTKADLDKAAKELSASGLFTKVQYKFRRYGDHFEVTFTVEESSSSMPVTFDNFVWFTDKELADAVRQEMPGFNGNAPDAEGAIKSIKKALTKLLQDRKLPGEVDYTSFSGDLVANKSTEHVFSVKGVSIPICSVHYQATSAVAESTLIDNSKALLNKEYSVKDVGQFVDGLRPFYGRIGHLRASFEIPTTKLKEPKDGACSGGVDVYVKVDEGVAYNWDKAEWSGNQALPVAALQKAMQMNNGEIADSTKIAAGYTRIQRAYGRIGYIAVRISPRPTFNDEARSVSYAITINEGAQYHMGKVTVTGIPDRDAKSLIDVWSLAEGAVYDDSYIDDYRTKLRTVLTSQVVAGKKMSFNQKVDWQNHIVNFVIEFK